MYESVSRVQHLHKAQFPISSVTSCVLQCAGPSVICLYHTCFYLGAIKKLSDDSPGLIENISQFKPVDGSDFETSPALNEEIG